MKVLVVEDHALVREGLLTTLKSLGPDTETVGAPDANQAIGVLEQGDVDLVVLDLMLPGTKGQTFLPVLRRRFPTVPVVILSALDDAETVSKVMKAGASGFVSKSGSSADLLDALRAVLDGASTCRRSCASSPPAAKAPMPRASPWRSVSASPPVRRGCWSC